MRLFPRTVHGPGPRLTTAGAATRPGVEFQATGIAPVQWGQLLEYLPDRRIVPLPVRPRILAHAVTISPLLWGRKDPAFSPTQKEEIGLGG